MRVRLVLPLLLLVFCACVSAQPLTNGVVALAPLGQPGSYTGFTLTAGGAEVATVLLGSDHLLTAKAVRAQGNALRFSGLACLPTPQLGPDSFVEVKLLPNDPYPEVTFRLDVRSFNQAAWEKRCGTVPFHFLVCSVPGAEIFHQRGWAIGTPVVDDYIQKLAEGPGRTIVSAWSRDWTYAPPIGSYPTAVAGLWNSDNGRYVAYDFHGARLTDHSEKDFGTTYCTKQGATEQFFCLTWPYGQHYINLRYPTTPVQCGTHFRLLWAQNLGPDADPNELVHEFVWKTYRDLLPDVETMNDLSWLPGNLRPSSFGAPGPPGNFVHNTGDTGERWWAPHVNIVGGVGYFSPVDYYFRARDQRSIALLGEQCRRVVKLGKWLDVGGDRCFYWQTPLDGGGAKMFGPGVETFHHVSPLGAGLAMLDYYRNDPQGAADLLPYIDGILNWLKHTLYTRNCYPDVPAAQFAWSATPLTTYCLKYYYYFRNDPTHREAAALAHRLAKSLTYRYLALWPGDNDDLDDLDASYLMEPNAGLPWLGCACANEIWVYNVAMLYEYLDTGDPIMGQYLRGMLERYHVMYQDQWAPSVREYGSDAFTERLGLYDECAQGRGSRANFGGLWGGFEQLIWPLGDAKARVLCGEQAALAFNKDGRHTDVADYRYSGNGDCSFKLVPGGLQADPQAGFDLSVTFPFFDLSGKTVTVLRDGVRTVLGEDRLVKYPAQTTTLTLRGVKLGDIIAVGKYDPQAPVLACALARPRQAPGATLKRGGFALLDLGREATQGLSRNWDDARSFAGYEPGVKSLYGVPFLLRDPETTGNKVSVTRGKIAVGGKPQFVFALVGGTDDKSSLTLSRDKQPAERVNLNGAVPALRGWPSLFEWHLDLVTIENQGKPLTALAPNGCQVFAVTTTDKSAAALKPALAALATKRAEVVAQRAMVKSVAELAPLFEPFSGHLAVLPAPGVKNPRATPLVKMLQEAGLARHLVLLSDQDLVNPRVFNTRNIWIAFYCGGEDYYQSVNRPGDGDEALTNWLKAGGTLVSLSGGPFPFYYNELDKPVVSASKFGLPVCGSGAGGRADTLGVVTTTGWEKAPEGAKLSFQVNREAKVFTSLPATLPWEGVKDPRWRPIFNVVGKENRYTPLVTLKDSTGKQFGDAAAMVEYQSGDLAGARVVYLWHGLRLLPPYERPITTDLLRYLLTHTLPPVGEYTCPHTSTPPVIDGKLDDRVWQQTPATSAFVRFDPNRGDGKTLTTTARLAWDEKNLYVAWECQDPDVWATLKDRDGDLWTEEVVELYLDPDGDGKDYAELEINPRNTVVDLLLPAAVNGQPQGGPQARLWDAAGWQHAVSVAGTLDNRQDRDTAWTAESALPLADVVGAKRVPPRVGDVWRAQLFRIDRSKSLPHEQFAAWSATDTFHNPARFGRLVFAGNPADDDFSAYADGAAPTPTWATLAGQWQVRDGVLVGKNSGTGGFTPTGCTAGGDNWTDYRLSLRFQVRERGSDHRDGAWIGFRYGGPGQCYCLAFGANAALLNKANRGVNSGDANPLAQAPWHSDSNWHTVTITAQGARLQIEVDGQPFIAVEDRDALGVPALKAGGVCLSARRWENAKGDTVVAFDDVKVESLAGG